MTDLSTAPADLPEIRVQFTDTKMHATHELVTVYAGDEHCGLLFLPRRLAWEFASRLTDSPPRVADITPEVVRHVRYVLDEDYFPDVDELPSPHLRKVIELLAEATEGERSAMGRAYPAYAVAVAIATGGPMGLVALRELHTIVINTAASG